MKVDKRVRAFTPLLGAITALAALSVDISLPALPAMTASFAAAASKGHWTLSLFVLGFAGGQLFLGPLSDRVGRRPVLLCGLAAYVLIGIACALAPSIELLIAARFLQGLSACAGAVVSRAIIRDVYDRQQAVAKQSILTVVTTMAMLVAPIAGAWILTMAGWRTVMAVLPLAGCLIFILAYRFIPETRARPDGSLAGVCSSYSLVLKEPITIGNAFVAAFIFAGLFSFIATSPTIFIKTLGVSPQVFSWMFATIAFGQLCGSILNRILAPRVRPSWLIRIGCGFTLSATLLIIAVMLLPLHVYLILAAISLYAFSLGMTNPNAIAAAMVPLPQHAGAASALIGFLYFTTASLGASLSGYFMPGTVHGMLAIVAALGTTGLAVLVALEVYQTRLPHKSRAYLPAQGD